ncbi:MAG: OmpA family protein [Limnobacter sp.]|nr:OmpA family protein [Limnobacter sp.]
MKRMSTLTQMLLAVAIGTASTAVMAHTTDKGENLSGYTVDNSGKIVKDPFGLCWRTGYFTPAMAVQECDPDLIPKKVVQAPAPAPAPVAPAPAPTPAPAPKVVVSKVNLEADAYFDFDKATLKPAGQQRIDAEIAKLGQVELNAVIAEGHTDSIGTDKYNQKLSERRAQAVKNYMVSKGVAADKITIKGLGESKPVADNKTKDGRAKNRRVEIEFTVTQRSTQ